MCVKTCAFSFNLASSTLSTHFSSSFMTWSSCWTVSFQVFASNLSKVSSLLPLNFSQRLPFQLRQVPPIPVHDVIGQLANRVIALTVGPTCLLRGQALHRNIRRHKPFFCAVRGLQFRQQHFSQRRRLLVLRNNGNRQHQKHKHR